MLVKLFEKLHPIANLWIVCDIDPSLGNHKLKNQHHKSGGKTYSRKDFIQSGMGILFFFIFEMESRR